MVSTYQIKLTNNTDLEHTFIIKAPNIPSPVPLAPDVKFPPLCMNTLAPSKSFVFTSKIPSDSQRKSPRCQHFHIWERQVDHKTEAHIFLVKATQLSGVEEHLLPLDSDILLDFWKDEGGLKGDYCSLMMIKGSRHEGKGNIAFEIGFSWQKMTLAPKIKVRGTGPGGAMRYEDK